MMRTSRAFALGVFLLSLCGVSPVQAAMQEVEMRALAVMPFGLFEMEGERVDFTRLVADVLREKGINVVDPDALADFLAARRIRRPEFLDRAAIRAMGYVLHTDALLMGYAEVLEDEDNPQVTVAAQLVDCVEGTVIWAGTLARTGLDDVTVLGLGKIESARELAGMTVRELFADLPPSVLLARTERPPFEVGRVSLSSDMVRGGQPVVVRVEIKEVVQPVREVRVGLGGREVVLQSRNCRWFEGRAHAPAEEGEYPVELIVEGADGREYGFPAQAALDVRNRPPDLTLALRGGVISPNRDGIREHALVVPSLEKGVPVRSWHVTVRNRDGVPVRKEAGLGEPPEAFVWRGTDGAERPVPDGEYRLFVEVEDAAGNLASSESVPILVDCTGPAVSVDLARDEGDSPVLRLKTSDASGIEFWELSVMDRDRKTRMFRGQGEPPAFLQLDRDGKVAGEEWVACTLAFRDKAGNSAVWEEVPLNGAGGTGTDGVEPESSEGQEPGQPAWVEAF